jgi:alpha-glucosidase
MGSDDAWWRRGIVYQIYPLSFMDASGDGVGDLRGIISRLDYVASLGVDAIWMSPIYPSPMTDFGYDVADYLGVDPVFGSMADFDELLAEVHRRGMRLILDLVPNHTSNLHPWFLESRSSRESPKRSWYVWRDPAPAGGPPNNWVGYFGSAWTFDARTGQYYFHQFRESQPELNYREPDVLEAIRAVMRFWLDKGVDGFRVDVIALLSKDELFRDEPVNRDYRPEQYVYHSLEHLYTQDLPVVHDYVRAMRSTLDEYEGRVMLGELDPIPNLMRYYGAQLDECHLPFNFHLLYEPWEAPVLRRTIEAYEAALPAGAWPNWVLGNHDKPRVASRVGHAQARVAQMLLLTLRGTPICYYGDEIGMTNVPIAPHRLRDWNAPNLADALRLSRDPQRTPMQWNASPNAGFSPPKVEPWLPVPSAHDEVNVAAENGSGHSMLNLFRRLSALRRELPALSAGTYRSLEVEPASAIVAYERRYADARALVALNLSDEPQLVDLGAAGARGEILLSTELDREGAERLAELRLRPNEGLIARVA